MKFKALKKLEFYKTVSFLKSFLYLSYCSKDNTPCVDWFAWASIACPA